MKTINDEVFGTMSYKHSWCKQDTLSLFGKKYVVQVSAKAYKNDGITDSQREAYIQHREFLESHKEKIEKTLREYVRNTTHTEQPLSELLNPTEILFEKDGSFGVLFEAEFDVENGVAMFVRDGKIIVNSQDILL